MHNLRPQELKEHTSSAEMEINTTLLHLATTSAARFTVTPFPFNIRIYFTMSDVVQKLRCLR